MDAIAKELRMVFNDLFNEFFVCLQGLHITVYPPFFVSFYASTFFFLYLSTYSLFIMPRRLAG